MSGGDRESSGPGEDSSASSPPRRSALRGLWRGVKFIGGGPVAALGLQEIADGGRLIGGLTSALRQRRSAKRPSLRVDAGGTIDVEATAEVVGLAVDELDARLVRRRRQTAWQAYVAFGLGWFFFAVWLYRAAFTVWTAGAALAAIEFAPFCAAFFLTAFRSALENYQIRTRRAASALEYLATKEESFWPS